MQNDISLFDLFLEDDDLLVFDEIDEATNNPFDALKQAIRDVVAKLPEEIAEDIGLALMGIGMFPDLDYLKISISKVAIRASCAFLMQYEPTAKRLQILIDCVNKLINYLETIAKRANQSDKEQDKDFADTIEHRIKMLEKRIKELKEQDEDMKKFIKTNPDFLYLLG